jgi:hypothetical protein
VTVATQTIRTPTQCLKLVAEYNTPRFDEIVVAKNYMDLAGLATTWLRQYTGTFGFLVDMKTNRTLSNRQVAGILNCMMADVRKAEKAAELAKEQDASPINLEADPLLPAPVEVKRMVANGTYTIEWSDGSYRTLKLADGFGDMPKEWQVAKFLNGPDNERSYTGFAFVKGRKFQVWKKFTGEQPVVDALKVLLDCIDPRDLGKAYARMSGNCYVCGRTLTTPESIEAGIGPICAGKV